MKCSNLTAVIIFEIIVLLFHSCGDPERKEESNDERKRTVVTNRLNLLNYQHELIELVDSTNIYLDYGLQALAEGVSAQEISDSIRPTVSDLQEKIIQKLKDFPSVARDLEMKQEDLDKFGMVLDDAVSELWEKRDLLIAAGVDLQPRN